MPEIVDEVVPLGTGRQPSGGRTNRRMIEESVQVGSSEAKPDHAGDENETVSTATRVQRRLSDNAKRMLANMDKHGTVDDDAPEADDPDDKGLVPDAQPQAAAGAIDAGAAPASPVAVSSAAAAADPDPVTEHIARAERLAEHNRRLVAELEQARTAPRYREPSARDKALDEAERTYLDDPIKAIRRLVATAIGSDDPNSKDVDGELTGLYQDLTERELSVSLDPVQKATREAARTRRLLERDKRERKAETTDTASKAEADADARHTAEVSALIGSKLSTNKHAERFPLLMAHAGRIDGLKPEELIWAGIKRGIAAGELDPKQSDDQLIDAVSKKIEPYYQSLRDALAGNPPPVTSTAAPQTQASQPTEIKAGPIGQGPRTITNASASVAPATPPAVKAAPTDDTKPKYRNEKERRRALAEKYFGK